MGFRMLQSKLDSMNQILSFPPPVLVLAIVVPLSIAIRNTICVAWECQFWRRSKAITES